MKGKIWFKVTSCPLVIPESTLLSRDSRQDRIYMQLQNLCWIPQWVFSGDLFPKDTSRSAVLTGVVILNLTFKNEMITSANCAAKRCSLQKANSESSKRADVSLVMTMPICTRFTFPLICILGQISSYHGTRYYSSW